jgi:hypothetical protein
MINHIRTLLLNRPREIDQDLPGEEYVPGDFKEVTGLPDAVRKARRILFGSKPDRYMLNYRLRQIMAALHSTELAEHVLDADSRVTYWPPRDDLYTYNFGTTASNEANNTGSTSVPCWFDLSEEEWDALTVEEQEAMMIDGCVDILYSGRIFTINDLHPINPTGQMHFYWKITVDSLTQITVRNLLPPVRQQSYEYTITQGLSSIIPLLDSSQSFRFSAKPGAVWFVRGVARPSRDMGTVLANLHAGITLIDELAIFGGAAGRNERVIYPEPYLTYRNLWNDHPEYAYRLGGLVMALALRTDETRKAS